MLWLAGRALQYYQPQHVQLKLSLSLSRIAHTQVGLRSWIFGVSAVERTNSKDWLSFYVSLEAEAFLISDCLTSNAMTLADR